MGVYKDVGVDRDQDSARPVDQITNLLPIAFGYAWLESFPFERVAPKFELAQGLLPGKTQAQGFLEYLAQGFFLASRLPPRLFQQIISHIDGCLHMANHTIAQSRCQRGLQKWPQHLHGERHRLSVAEKSQRACS